MFILLLNPELASRSSVSHNETTWGISDLWIKLSGAAAFCLD